MHFLYIIQSKQDLLTEHKSYIYIYIYILISNHHQKHASSVKVVFILWTSFQISDSRLLYVLLLYIYIYPQHIENLVNATRTYSVYCEFKAVAYYMLIYIYILYRDITSNILGEWRVAGVWRAKANRIKWFCWL